MSDDLKGFLKLIFITIVLAGLIMAGVPIIIILIVSYLLIFLFFGGKSNDDDERPTRL